jgi:hypothetical protein
VSKVNLPSITLNSQVSLHLLSRQRENGVAIIGRGDQFLELPPEGLDFINWLNEGLTLREARERFEAIYSPFPEEDVLEVVHTFLECDFVATVDNQVISSRRTQRPTSAPRIRQEWAQALFSKPVLIAWMLFCIPAVSLWVITPALWPRAADYFWIEYYFLIVLVDILLGLALISSHELAHWLACRAKGIEATITWTQRMGVWLMSQTIMHNIWAVPRQARLLPLAAGMAWDVFLMSMVLYLLFLAKIGWLILPLLLVRFLKFYVLAATMSLVGQFWLFSRMDGYFLLSALLGQRNLQGDTFQWFKSKIRRAVRFEPPASGMNFIYIYALIVLLGGGLFLGQFLLIELPIKLHLIWESLLKLGPGGRAAPLDFADGVAVLTSQVIYLVLMIYVYWRDTIPGLKQI